MHLNSMTQANKEQPKTAALDGAIGSQVKGIH